MRRVRAAAVRGLSHSRSRGSESGGAWAAAASSTPKGGSAKAPVARRPPWPAVLGGCSALSGASGDPRAIREPVEGLSAIGSTRTRWQYSSARNISRNYNLADRDEMKWKSGDCILNGKTSI